MSLAEAPIEIREGLEDLRVAAGDDELVAAVLSEALALAKQRRPRGRALSGEQAAFLVESGVFTEDSLARTEEQVARGELAELERRTRLEAITASLSAAEVAERLDIDESRVRHRQSKGGLYSFMVGRKRRYPMWQFTEDLNQPVLPGLAMLVKAIPEDMHPASVQGFMGTPQNDLRDGDRRLTPAEWLMAGRDPQSVVDTLESFLRW